MEKKPIRILHIVPNMQAGGLETLIMNIYRNIDREKIQFDFLVHYKEKYFYDDEIEELGGKIYRFSLRNDNNFLKYLFELDKFFKKHNEYKIVHGHMESLGQFYFWLAKKNNISIRIAHSHNSSTEKTLKGKIKSILLKRYKNYATDYFACSKLAGEYMFKNKPYIILKNGIISDKFIFNPNIRNEVRKELDIEDKFVVGHVGRFCKQKNHELLIEIFAKLLEKKKDSVLVLIGTGETLQSIKELVTEKKLNDSVIFLGVRKDIERLYQGMDCFVFPSIFEGLGIVTIEAQCSGLPVIASNTVPKEANISKDFSFVSLDAPVNQWVEKILKIETNKRNINKDIVKNSGYDIKEISDFLQEFYINKVRKDISDE